MMFVESERYLNLAKPCLEMDLGSVRTESSGLPVAKFVEREELMAGFGEAEYSLGQLPRPP